MKHLLAGVLLLLCAVTAFAAAYQNDHLPPQQAMVLTIQREQWQALAAAGVCDPRILCGQDPHAVDHRQWHRHECGHHSPRLTKVTEWGATAAAATATLATRYWQRAECVFVHHQL